jgi:AcrR family transcriptional regulator
VAKRALRADAARNRARLLEVAAKVFAAEGLAVPIDEVARRAGIGIGTVYRHFPTKEALFAAIVRDKLERLIDHATSVADDRDAGAAFFAVLDRMMADAAHKKDLVHAVTGAGIDVRAAGKDVTSRLHKALGLVLRRAQAAGAVRVGVKIDEILALLAAVLDASARTGASPARLYAVVRDGLRP